MSDGAEFAADLHARAEHAELFREFRAVGARFDALNARLGEINAHFDRLQKLVEQIALGMGVSPHG